MKKELPKVYDPHEVEDRIYRNWMESGCFRGVSTRKEDLYDCNPAAKRHPRSCISAMRATIRCKIF